MGAAVFWIVWLLGFIFFSLTNYRQRRRWVHAGWCFVGASILIAELINFSRQGYLTLV